MCTAYLDYPLLPGVHTKPYSVTVLSFDGNKYCEVLYSGVKFHVKLWYLWEDEALTIQFDVNRLQNIVDNNRLNIILRRIRANVSE